MTCGVRRLLSLLLGLGILLNWRVGLLGGKNPTTLNKQALRQ